MLQFVFSTNDLSKMLVDSMATDADVYVFNSPSTVIN